MSRVCGNPACRHYQTRLPVHLARANHVRVPDRAPQNIAEALPGKAPPQAEMAWVAVDRHLYISPRHLFNECYLCGSCHGAVKLIQGMK